MRTPILPLIGLAALLAIGLSHCIATSAQAQLLPPEEFDHPYDGHLMIEHARSEEEVRERCPGGNFPRHALACARVHKYAPMCIIVKVSDDTLRAHGYDPAVVMRHEIAHCNGWPADHKGAR